MRDVVNHLAFGFLLAHRSGARQPWDPSWTGADRTPYLVGLAEDGWAQACADEAEATARVWADPSTWEGETQLTNNVQAQFGISIFFPFSFEYRLPK